MWHKRFWTPPKRQDQRVTKMFNKLLYTGFFLLNLHIALSELILATYKGITQENLIALPTFKCKPAENHNAKSLINYIVKSNPSARKFFILGYSKTSFQHCYIYESSSSQMRLPDNGLKWYAHQGKECFLFIYFDIFQ